MKSMGNTISAVTARTQLGQILRRAGENDERFLVDRRGEPAVIIMSVKDYIKNIAPTPTAYSAARQEAKRKGTGGLSMREIDREIAAVRRAQDKGKRRQPAA
jgi:prevent-host-death family protein